jgi:hypothetical protein
VCFLSEREREREKERARERESESGMGSRIVLVGSDSALIVPCLDGIAVRDLMTLLVTVWLIV